MDDRRKALELLAKGKISTDSLINPNQSMLDKALDARDLNQSALAAKVFKDTGIPIPGRNAKASKIEDFYGQLAQERYPELKDTTIDLADLSKENARGQYFSGDKNKWIELQKDLWKKNPESAAGTLFHELGHAYDDQVLGQRGKPLQTNLKLPDSMSPEQAYEIMSNKHHTDFIPGKREVGSFGKGALESLMKNGTFRQVAAGLPLVGGAAAAAMSGDAMAAVPVLGEAGEVGESSDSEKQMLNEYDAKANYNKSQARKDALTKLGK